MAADFTISQAGGAGAGTLNTELLAVWGGLVLQLDAAAAAAYSWTILDKPHGAVATIVSPTAQNATLTPDDLPGRWRIQLTTPDGSRVLVFEVTKTVAGVVYNFGLGVTPAHLERPSEAGGRGAARVFERFRASLLSLISALPGAEKLLLRDATGAAVASSFTGGSTLDTEVTADAARVVHVGRVGDARLRFGSASGLVYLDRWNGSAHVPSGIFGASVDTLYMSDGAGTAEVILGPSSAAISSGGVCSLTAGTTLTLSAGSLDCAITNVSGTYQVAPAAPMRIQPAQATSGAGRAVTIGGGPGQTPGTHLAGKTIVDLGASVSNTSTSCDFMVDGVRVGYIRRLNSAYNFQLIGTTSIDVRADSGSVFLSGSSVVVDTSSWQIRGTQFIDQRPASNQNAQRLFATSTTTTTTSPTVVATIATDDNATTVLELRLIGRRSGSGAFSLIRRRIIANRDAGTLTIVDTETDGTDYDPSVIGSVAFTASGGNVIVTVTPATSANCRWTTTATISVGHQPL